MKKNELKESIEKLSLEMVLQDKVLKRFYDEWGTYGKYDEPILIDRCMDYKKQRGHKDDQYYVMLRKPNREVSKYGWEVSLVDNGEPTITIICNGRQIEHVTQQLWSTSQHLRLDDYDGRNVAWDYARALDWWELVCFKAGMLLKYSPTAEYEPRYC